MGTLSGLFDLTRSALAADQAALVTTSNNVANQNTTGYVRQTAVFTAGDSVTLSGGGSEIISGPTLTVASQRDRVLEQRVQQQTQVAASSSAQASALSQIESVFSLDGSSATAGSTQIGTSLDSFFSSLAALASSPSDTATRAGVLASASAVASAFNSAATQLAQVGTGISANVITSVAQVNTLAASIASLNQQITSGSPTADAGALEDQRQDDLAQLSQLVGLNQISTEANGLTLTTQGGAVLVEGGQSFALAANASGSSVAITDSTGKDVTATVQGGSIGGQLATLNSTLPATNSTLDAIAYRIATAVNAQNEAGVTATGGAGGAIFTIGTSAAGSAANIAVLATSVASIAASGAGEGSSGNTNALALQALATATDGSGTTISGQFAGLLAQVGTAASAVTEQNTADTASLSQLTTQRDSLSGVSLDDEAANLSQYQRSYEAAAKVLSVLDTLLAAAINIGTETTVS